MHNNTSEIAKLTERIAKDPKSKLFVPLAEEYKKAGDTEMSIQVLQEGLTQNPGYVSARSLLGKLLIEKGDFPGAQKEFEEVVKAIPDNLMGQRKLGDVYALQDKPADALVHYKSALSLSPKDTEISLLISEIEAGNDIKKHLVKFIPSAPEPLKKQDQAGPVQTATAKVHSRPQSIAAPSKRPEAVQSLSREAVEEEAEEVLVVEPLDPPQAASAGVEKELAARNLGFLAETDQAPVPDEFGEDNNAPSGFGDPFAATAEAPGFEEEQTVIRTAGKEGGEERKEPADDFTTDTLAELYISQGFYEKAMDIYERMLVDMPDSRGLRNKLENVKSMAAAAAATEESVSFNPSVAGEMPASELDALVPVQDSSEPGDGWAAPETPLEEDVPPQAPHHFDPGFEPQEYVPPDTVSTGRAEQAGGGTPLSESGEKPDRESAAAKKETIARLENWLKNIKKET